MILATVITNLVMALMIQKPSVTINNNGTFGISVETQYIHSVTLHEFDGISVHNCKMCNKPIILAPIDYLGVKPCSVQFNSDKLRQHEFHSECNPWVYINTNVWFNVINSNNYKMEEVWQ